MDNLQLLILMLYIISGVLSLILFFKIWIMTDDIRTIKNMIKVGLYKSKPSTDDIGFRFTIDPKTRKLVFEEREIVT